MMIYKTRYKAEKVRRKGEEVVVKVCGGYTLMTHAEYRVWKNQK